MSQDCPGFGGGIGGLGDRTSYHDVGCTGGDGFFRSHDACLISVSSAGRAHSRSDDYELVLTFPDGRQEVEKYQDPHMLIERSQRLQETLRKQGWAPPTNVRVPGSRIPSAAG